MTITIILVAVSVLIGVFDYLLILGSSKYRTEEEIAMLDEEQSEWISKWTSKNGKGQEVR